MVFQRRELETWPYAMVEKSVSMKTIFNPLISLDKTVYYGLYGASIYWN